MCEHYKFQGDKILLSISFLLLAFCLRSQIVDVALYRPQWIDAFDGFNIRTTAVDTAGNTVIGGTFLQTIDVDPKQGTLNLVPLPIGNNSNVAVVKVSSEGKLLWARHIPTSEIDDVEIDDSGNVYVLGEFGGSVDFDPGPDTFLINSPISTIFLLKYDPNGNFVWVKYLEKDPSASPSFNPRVTADLLTFDNAGNILIAGRFERRVDFDPGPAMHLENGTLDFYVLKLDPQGNFLWVKVLYTAILDKSFALKADNSGNVYLVGRYNGTIDFDPGPGTFSLSSNGNSSSGFVLKLSSSGNFKWAKSIDGNNVVVMDLAFQNDQKPILVGGFNGNIDRDPGPGSNYLYTSTSGGFIMKLDTMGNYNWFQYIVNGVFQSIGVDQAEQLILAGSQSSANFTPHLSHSFNLSYYPFGGLFVAQHSSNGNFLFAEDFGSTGQDYIMDLHLDRNWNILLSGKCYGTAELLPGIGSKSYVTSKSSLGFLIKEGYCDLKINYDSIQTCDEFTFGNSTITNSGIFKDTLSNQFGCDSIVEIFVDIKLSSDTILQISDCSSFTSVTGKVFTKSGIYYDTLSNHLSCDSVIFYDVNILSNDTALVFVSCGEMNSPSGNQIWNISGNYVDTLTNSAGCDSLLYVDFRNGISEDSIKLQVCDSSLSPSGKYWLTSTAYFPDTLINMHGCDSILYLDVEVNSTNAVNVFKSGCSPYILPDGKVIYHTGLYRDTLLNRAGCDSVLTYHLSLDTLVEARILNVNDSLKSENSGSHYIWLNCDSLYEPLAGEISDFFIPSKNGSYALVLYNGNCSDTSSCFNVRDISSFPLLPLQSIALYPNPAINEIMVECPAELVCIGYKITDLVGNIIVDKSVKVKGDIHIKLDDLSVGLYNLNLNFENGLSLHQIFKVDP